MINAGRRSPQREQFRGLEWVQKTFDLVPQWTVEVDQESIKLTVEKLRPSQNVVISFLAQGAFNKLYDIRAGDESLIMRVSLPVDPYYKTLSEVATIDWVSRNTQLPVPKVIAYEPRREKGIIGFEWILMTKIPGRPLADAWRSMSYAAKEQLVRQLAMYSYSSFKNQLRGIGNLYPETITSGIIENRDDGDSIEIACKTSHRPPRDVKPFADGGDQFLAKDSLYRNEEKPSNDKGTLEEVAAENLPKGLENVRDVFNVSRIVSMPFVWGDHVFQDIYRGPFYSGRDWIAARLSLHEHDCNSTLAKYQDRVDLDSSSEDDVEDWERTKQIVKKLKARLGDGFPSTTNVPEHSILFHDDLSRHNILVDEDGQLTGVVDWECVSALPLWKACSYPSFLEGRSRASEPDRTRYRHDANGEPDSLYWEHFEEYELTKLRQYFLGEMRELESEWIEVHKSSQMQRDFDVAVQNCDNVFLAKLISEWCSDICTNKENENVRSLRDRIDES